MADVEIVPVAANDAALLATVRDLFREYERSIGVDLAYQGFPAELAGLPGAYAPPGGALVVARAGGLAAGCVAVRPLGEAVAEMKRLYVREPHRGTGLGRRLAEAAIDAARAAGHAVLRLDTLPTMTSALGLYRALGFEATAPYGSGHLPGTCFFARRLDR